ncbi:sulfatase family protein [Flexithrix dorotheae]|uniref:sulfatase family protein n=1 Tax=Flexithrix dorotheae TaxID=70993 RepID=UPI00036CF286|nr:sulfatase [Flexithrix dorotheae]
MKYLLFLFFLIVFKNSSANDAPNIVFILADDCTKWDIGTYGSKDAVTPTIDQLALDGMKFTRCYQAAPMCSPTRHSLMTGVFPVRSGAYPNHTMAYNNIKSIVHYLKPLNYRVALAGKRHILPQEVFPFEYLEGHAKKEKNPDFTEVEKFISGATQKDEKFCLFICSTEPHSPWNKGDSTLFDLNSIKLPPYLADTPETRRQFRNYLAEINYLDNQVKQTLELLKKYNQEENTIVFFASEQGNSFPFAKWTLYNAGLSSALIVKWPGKISPGSVSDALVDYLDIVPTFIDLAGESEQNNLDGKSLMPILNQETNIHKSYTFGIQTTRGIYNGSEYYPIRSVSNGKYRLIWNISAEMAFQNNVTEKNNYFKEWEQSNNPEHLKLVKRYKNRPEFEFFEEENDPYNMKNLVNEPEFQSIIEEMKKVLKEWMAYCGDKGLTTELYALEHQRNKPIKHFGEIAYNPIEPGVNGNLKIERKGFYTFYFNGIGKLMINDKLLVEDIGNNPEITNYRIVYLLPGSYQLQVKYQGKSGPNRKLEWSGPEIKKQALILP